MASAAPAIEPDDPGTHIPGEEPPARDYDSEARELGWLPKEEFKGDPSRWTDAETFVRKGDEVMPLIKAQNKRLRREIDDLKKQMRQASAHFSKAEERAYARALADLQEKQEAAVESGDLAAHRAVSKEIDALAKDMPGKPANQATAEEAREAWDDWREENAWYDRANLASAPEADVNARLYADRMVEKHIEKTKDMPPAEFFDFIGGLVKEKYPLIGRKPAREKPPSDVAPTTGARPAARGKGWGDMEPEERRVAERLAEKWVKSGLLKKKDDYLASYDWTKK
jgi:hypothetical protein